MRLVENLADAGQHNVAEVGSKAAALGEMARAGMPVPEGFVVTASALGDPAAGEALSKEVAQAITDAAASFGEAAVAVRSSAIAEDLPSASYAGQYESVLDVRGAPAILEAIVRCRASAATPRVEAYRDARGDSAPSAMAIIVQRMVNARAAGVAFTADPVSGERDVVVVNAVRGLGERLVSGASAADEWIVRGSIATCRRSVEGSLDEASVLNVAALARRVEAAFGAPQDIEWALSTEGTLKLLQARPITSLPEAAPAVEWKAPDGCWARNFRLGEWLGGPVTPLFESWLLERIEESLAAWFQSTFGFPPRPPHHVLVNGWYFGSMNFIPSAPLEMLWTMVRYFLPRFIRRPRWVSVGLPPLAGLGVELHVRDWEQRILPAYRAQVAEGEGRVDRLSERELVTLIDDLGASAGTYFASMLIVAGYAWKAELPLAEYVRKVKPGANHLPLLVGLGEGRAPPHAVFSLDWSQPTLGEVGLGDSRGRAGLEDERRAAEDVMRAAADAMRADLKRFEALLAQAQRFARLREAQVADFTLSWPLMRRAVRRLGDHLADRGILNGTDDIFFITRDELAAALGGATTHLRAATGERRRAWERQRRLSPPLVLGEMPPMMRGIIDRVTALHPRAEAEGARQGLGASPGRAVGPVRVVRGPEEFQRLAPGDVLVAPATTPAWTPLFARAAAVVTDTGSILSHTSVVAREYGIPSVVGMGDATTRLTDGQAVTVDGNAGTVTLNR
jgi:pyruvate,water dikinase